MNEHTATALSYGIYRSNDFDETVPRIVAFCSIGHSHFSCSIVKFLKGKLEVLSEHSDRQVGGRHMDRAIMAHFGAEFQKKYGVDPLANQKSRYKLEEAAQKCRMILSANRESQISIECLVDEYDLHGLLNRDQLEELIAPMAEKMMICMGEAIKEANLSNGVSDIHSVEIVGGCSRMPFVQNCIQKAFGKEELSKTLNADESVARGCALQAAMLSPLFKVREFAVIDYHPLAISIQYMSTTKDDEMHDDENTLKTSGEQVSSTLKTSVVFPPKSHMNLVKVLTFWRKDSFDVSVNYLKPSSPLETSGEDASCTLSLGTYHIQVPKKDFGVSKTEDDKKIKLRAKLSLDGIFSIETAQLYYDEEVEEISKEKRPKVIDVDMATSETPADPSKTTLETSGEDFEWVEVKNLKKKTKKIDLIINSTGVPGIPQEVVQQLKDLETKMIASDREVRETNERRNDLEGLIYNLRGKLDDALAPFVAPGAVDSLQSSLTKTEDWLYDTFDATKAIYEDKIIELQSIFKPIERLQTEEVGRIEALAKLENMITKLTTIVDSVPEQYNHISKEKFDLLAERISDATTWAREKNSTQNERKRFEEPAVLTKEIEKVYDDLKKFSEDILKEPKPVVSSPPKTSGEDVQTTLETGGEDVNKSSPVKTGAEDTDEGVTPADGSKVMDLD